MDMRNAVILIDQIEHDAANGMSLWDAVVESAVRRARPVVLTAATAILAMIPLTRSVLWGPLAVAIMGGLSVATFLTLGNLPALYVLLFRVKRPTEPLPPPAPRPEANGRAGRRCGRGAPPADERDILVAQIPRPLASKPKKPKKPG